MKQWEPVEACMESYLDLKVIIDNYPPGRKMTKSTHNWLIKISERLEAAYRNSQKEKVKPK